MRTLEELFNYMTDEEVEALCKEYKEEFSRATLNMLLCTKPVDLVDMIYTLACVAFASGRKLEMINVTPPQTIERIPHDN